MTHHRGWSTALWLALGGCAARPPVPAIAPYGDHWLAYNQSYTYNMAAASTSTTSYAVGNVTVTTTTTITTTTEVDQFNEGSFAAPSEGPTCEGYGWLADCPAFGGGPLAQPVTP